nr:YoaK family protein [Petropleomorpha daqingensis]
MLLLLTLGTGLVDAVSILALGRVFVANMTGNIVFIGFALAGAPGFSLAAALVALAGFLVGAGVAGPLIGLLHHHRGRVLAVVTTAETALLGAALIVAALTAEPFGAAPRNLIAGLAAVALGMQNTAARELAVPDATTTVLTMTLTGVAADLRERNVPVLLRRVFAVAAMLLGGLVGALLVLNLSAAAALAPAVVLVAAVSLAAWLVSRRPAPWHERGR